MGQVKVARQRYAQCGRIFHKYTWIIVGNEKSKAAESVKIR